MKNRVALVTGAGRGIGRAIALELGRRGARVAVCARTREQLEAVVNEIEMGGGKSLLISADLTDRSAPRRIVAPILERWGPVEILVNNAGVGSSDDPQPIVRFDDDFWDLTMLLNVTAPYLLTKQVLPDMMRAGWGRIINISSIAARVAGMHSVAYTASKHAIAGLTKATAEEAIQYGVTANAICPAATESLINDKRLEYDAERLGVDFAELERQSTPLGRRLHPEEIAAAAAFLATEKAGAINGQLINVCGGSVMF